MGLVKLKHSVHPKSLVILAAVANVAQKLPHDVMVTSGNDSTHMVGSAHYDHAAIDVRSKNFPSREAKLDFLAAVLARLGPMYQGFLEHEGKANEHFHVEFDPT